MTYVSPFRSIIKNVPKEVAQPSHKKVEPQKEASYVSPYRKIIEKEPEKGFGRQALDYADDLLIEDIGKGIPRNFAKGVAQIGDIVGYPVRKGAEFLLNREIPTLEEGAIPKHEAKTMPGRILNKSAEYAGGMFGGAGAGTSLIKSGLVSPVLREVAKTASRTQKLSTGVKNLPRRTVNLLGNPQSSRELGELVKGGGTAGLVSGSLQEMGADPLAADLGSAGILMAKPIYKIIASKYAHARKLNSFETQALRELENQIGTENLDDALKKLNNFKKSSIEGYTPSTAEVVNNVGVSQVHRAAEGHFPQLGLAKEQGSHVLGEHLDTLAPQNANVADLPSHVAKLYNRKKAHIEAKQTKAEKEKESILSLFKGTVNPERTGEVLRPALEKKLEARERLRAQKTHPLYEALEAIEAPAPAKHTSDYIIETINDKGVKDPIKNDFLSIRNSLVPNKLMPAQKKLIAEQEKLFMEIENSSHPESVKEKLKEEIRKQLGLTGDEMSPMPRELNNARKLVDRKRAMALKSNDYERAHYLGELKSKLIQDLEPFPEAAAATKTYHEYSKPITEIKGDRALNKAIEQDIYKNAYKIGPAEIPDLFTKGTTSIRNARNLLKVLRKDKQTLGAFKEHIEEDFYNAIRDKNGNINSSSVQAWIKAHPGAKILHPEFFNESASSIFNTSGSSSKKTISSVLKAQQGAEQAAKNVKNFHKENTTEALSNILGKNNTSIDVEDSKQIFNKLLSGDNKVKKMKEAVALAKEDKSGKALEALQKGILDQVVKQTSLASVGLGGRNNISYNGMRVFMRENAPALSKVLSKEQMKGLIDLEKVLKRRNQILTVATATGSPTSANLQNSIFSASKEKAAEGAAHAFLKAIKLGKIATPVISGFKNYQSSAKKSVLDTLLSDPIQAKQMINRYKELPSHYPKGLFPVEKSLLTQLLTRNIKENKRG